MTPPSVVDAPPARPDDGAYLARVRAVSAFDITSIWRDSTLTQLKGKEGLPPAVAFLNTSALVYAIGLAWGL